MGSIRAVGQYIGLTSGGWAVAYNFPSIDRILNRSLLTLEQRAHVHAGPNEVDSVLQGFPLLRVIDGTVGDRISALSVACYF